PATVAPSVVPSEPTVTPPPSKTPKPPKTAPPSTGPSLPNLVITKFVAANDPILVGAKTNGRVTIKNDGTADAGPFALGWGFSADEGGGGGGNVPQPVDGLAAGDSVQLTVDLSLDFAGGFTFTATADSGNVITESNEDDNTATLHVTAVSEPNLVWPDGGFSVTADTAGNGGYDLNYQAQNSGTADTTVSFQISFAWSNSLASGTFPAEDCCFAGPGTEDTLPAGQLSTQYSVQSYQFPSQGTYTVVATLDASNVIPESNEADNTATYDVTVP
ncbi:MAG TPA: CARDB domain-containing protein, partial [Candidatus Limnocylindrales bacterium]